MAEKVNKIPNQNNINDVILSQINNMTSIINTIVKAATNKTIDYSNETLNKIKVYDNFINTLLSNNGVVLNILKAAVNIQKIDTKNIEVSKLKDTFKILNLIHNYIHDLISNISRIGQLPEIKLDSISNVIRDLTSLMSGMDKENKNKMPLSLKFAILKNEIKRTVYFIEKLSRIKTDNSKIQSVVLLITSIKNIYKDITTILESFDNVTTINIVKYWLQLELIKSILIKSIKTITYISAIKINDKSFNKSVENIEKLNVIIESINSLFITTANSKPLLALIKIQFIIVNLKLLENVIFTINSIGSSITKKTLIDVKNLLSVFTSVNNVFAEISSTRVFLAQIKLILIGKVIKIIENTINHINKLKISKRTNKNILKISLIIGALSALFTSIVISIPFILVSSAAIPLLTVVVVLLAISIKAIVTMINWAGKNIVKSILNILLIKSFILSISVIMLIFALVATSVIHVASSVLLFIGIVALVVIEIGLLGGLVILAAPILVPALLAFGVVALAILGLATIAGLLKLIEVINLDKDKISENINIIFDTVKEISSTIFSGSETKENKPVGWLQKIGSFIGNTFGAIGSALLTIPFLSLSIIAIFSVIFISIQLAIIQSLKLDKNLITSNVETIISTTKKVTELIGEIDGDVEIKDVKRFRRIKRIVNQITKIAKNLNKIGKVELEQNIILDKVGTIFTFIGKLQGHINDMLYGGDETKQTVSEIADFIPIARFVKNRAEAAKDNQAKRKLNRLSKITNTLNNIGSTLTSIQNLNIDESIITQKVTDIFTFIGNLDATIFKFMSEDTKDSNDIIDSAKLSKREWKKANKKLSKVEGVIATLHEIGSALNIIKDLNLNEIKDEKSNKTVKTIILDNINTIFTSIDEISSSITKNSNTKFDAKKAEQLNPLIDYITKLNNGFANISSADSSSVEQNIGNYIKFVDKVNTIDVERIKTTSQMFEQMSNFSNSIKGDFDKLAESLSEKLLPVLEELKEVMSDVPEKIDIGFQNTSASIAATNAAPTKENITAQVNRENPNLDEETINRLVNERLNERAKADANGIEAKLDALITLLKGQGANRVVVHTI